MFSKSFVLSWSALLRLRYASGCISVSRVLDSGHSQSEQLKIVFCEPRLGTTCILLTPLIVT